MVQVIAWRGFACNPLIFLSNGWHFWTETWSDLIGPFHSCIEAAANLLEYCENLNQEGGTTRLTIRSKFEHKLNTQPNEGEKS